ncbi:MAG: NAD(P)H-binding protein [Acidobacteriota bacterium]
MILVTGAGGTIGSEVVKALSATGARFRVAFKSQDKAEHARRSGLDAALIDFADPKSLGPALRGVERLFLLGTGALDQTEKEIAAVDAAKAAGVAHVVKLSVWGAETEGFSFAKIHRPVERHLQASGLTWTLLRPNGFMQNVVNYYATTIKSQNAFYLPSRGARISHVDARDVAAVAATALTKPGFEARVLTLSGPEALTYTEIARKLSAALGREITYVDVPDEAFKQGAIAAGIPAYYVDALIDLIHFYSSHEAGTITPDVQSVTGRPPISFDSFANDYKAALSA